MFLNLNPGSGLNKHPGLQHWKEGRLETKEFVCFRVLVSDTKNLNFVLNIWEFFWECLGKCQPGK